MVYIINGQNNHEKIYCIFEVKGGNDKNKDGLREIQSPHDIILKEGMACRQLFLQ